MSELYTDSILKENQKYLIQDIKGLRDTKRFIGLSCLFRYIPKGSSTASVMITGTMQSVPVRCLIYVKGYIAASVNSENADGFAVIQNNNLGLPVGQAYLAPDKVDNLYAYFTIDSKSIKVPLSILCSLVKVKEKINTKTSKALKSKNIPVEALEELSNSSLRKDILEVPSSLSKLLPNLNKQDLYNTIKTKTKEVFDYSGEVHSSIEEADRANTILRHKMLEEILLELANEHFKNSFQSIRQVYES